MEIKENSFVTLTYVLTVDGEVADQTDASRPLEFIFGINMLLPKFEEQIKGLKPGDTFKFTLTPENAYGEYHEEAIIPVDKNMFFIDGEFKSDLVFVGAVLPMMDQDGNQRPGLVKEITDDKVIMDFNHPMGGKTLNFEGKIVAVRESTPEDFARLTGGGCGCGSGCGSDCGAGGCCDAGSCCH